MTTTTGVHWPFVGRRSELERFSDALRDGRLEALLVTGASGVGKSRLAQECLASAEALGHPVAHVAATASAAEVPLSALAPLLPARVDLAEPHALFESVRQRLRDRSSDHRFVLAVDDIDLLDLVSLALLSFLLADGSLFVIATQRAEAHIPDALESRWRTGSALRMRLDSLDRQGVETLLHFALNAPVSAAAAQALWDASQGNILYLRELVWCAQADGTLDGGDGVWRLRGRLTGSATIVELVGQRLRGLSKAHRRVLELLALCEPLGVDDLLEHCAVDTLTELEEQGLIVVRPDGRRQQIALAHPLHARALQHAMPRLHARSLLLAQVERVERRGGRRSGDPLLLASWRLDATGTADPALLVRAARLARYAHDSPRIERLAEAALRHGPDTSASLLLGESLTEQGRHQDAERVFAAAWPSASDQAMGPLGLARASNLYFGLGQIEQAQARLHETARRGGAALAPAVAAVDSMLVNAVAGAERAIARLGDTEPPESNPSHLNLWLRSRAILLAETGRLDDAAEAAIRGHALPQHTDDWITIPHPAGHLVILAEARLHSGRFAEAERTARSGLETALRDELNSLVMWFSWQLGRVALGRGRVATAERLFREAGTHARGSSQAVAGMTALAGLVRALAYRAMLTERDPLLAQLDRAAGAAPRVAELQRARAWALASLGRQAQAREILLSTARLCLEQGRRTDATALLHDLVRLGDATTAGPELIAVAALVQGEFAAVRAAHARAALSADPDGLAEVGELFAGLGAYLLAAEALLAASALYRAEGGQRAATACLSRATALREQCEGARTPGLVADSGPIPLSDREREVAALVARGLRSPEIAKLLFISVRTVNNHLQNIYGKLGVNSRGELAERIAAPGASGTEGQGRR